MNITSTSIAIMQARNTFETHSCHFLQLRQMHVQLKAKSMQRRVYEACHFGLNKERSLFCSKAHCCALLRRVCAPKQWRTSSENFKHFNLRQLVRSFFSSKMELQNVVGIKILHLSRDRSTIKVFVCLWVSALEVFQAMTNYCSTGPTSFSKKKSEIVSERPLVCDNVPRMWFQFILVVNSEFATFESTFFGASESFFSVLTDHNRCRQFRSN